MSDIFEAMGRRATEVLPSVDLSTLDEAKLFPPPINEQQTEFAKIATRVLQFPHHPKGCLLAIASTVSGEGASYVSYNLARILALNLGQRTLWVDANFRSPHPWLRHVESDTLAEYLTAPSRVELREPAGMLSVMAGGLDLPTKKAALASESCRQVFDGLRRQYAFILVDCPPVLEGVEAGWLGRAADGMVLVVEARRLKSQIVSHGLQTLREQKVNVLGTVLNKRRFELPKAIYDRV